jgi:hypothetical protein
VKIRAWFDANITGGGGGNIVAADEFVRWPPYPLSSRSAGMPSSASATPRDDATCLRALPRRNRS